MGQTNLHGIIRKTVSTTAKAPEIIPQGRGQFLVQSLSRPKEYHAVNIDLKTMEGECSCEDTHFRKRDCRHVIFIKELLKRVEEKKLDVS